MTDFKRENRYVVLKGKDILKYLTQEEKENLHHITYKIQKNREAAGKPLLVCVVVERDWPEYEQAWELIKNRVDDTKRMSNKMTDKTFLITDAQKLALEHDGNPLTKSQKEMLKSLPMVEGEPVGIVVYKPKMLRVGALNKVGMALPDGTRLYTHPPAPRKQISADDVTDEMHTEWKKVFENNQHIKDGEIIAAAVNAWGAKK
jgi:hypothetical protein